MTLPAIEPAHQRAVGEGCIAVRSGPDGTRLDRLYQQGCAKILLPRRPANRATEAVLINTSGGLTGGDRLSWTAEAASDASLVVTTQASERVYRSPGGVADVDIRLSLESGSRLLWLPQETILFHGSALSRRMVVEMAADATLLIVEALVLGRAAMGEEVRELSFRDSWRIDRDGALIHAEESRIEGDAATLFANLFVAGAGRAVATVLLIAPDAEHLLPEARAEIGNGGASAWNGKLLARLVVEDSYQLRKQLGRLLPVLASGEPLPKCWAL